MKTKVILIKLAIIGFAFILARYTTDGGKQIISIIGFAIAFVASLIMHKHFFPFVTTAITCYLMAASQELWNDKYAYLEITKLLWVAGNILLSVGFLKLLLETIKTKEDE